MITDEQKDNSLLQYYNVGIGKKEIRSYEVSLWTLQDSFITVLKWSDVEQRGRIENPKMTLDVDGTQEFTFSIPMFYYQNGVRIENPNWYNTQNGNLLAGLRKIKVIFNKGETAQQIFEFVILTVDESHENDVLTCEVKCEGLAFHELGKIGYKLDLSPDIFYLDYKKWAEEDGDPEHEPIQSLDYWCEQAGLELLDKNTIINPKRWYYSVQMNQSAFEGQYTRSSNKLYEETYVTSWDEDLNPIASKSYQIKARPVEVKNSNIYNITQTIAETFGIFCRYEYMHDENQHISGKVVVFYNNYFQEEQGYMSLTYPYSSTRISRNMDSTDLTTKLYVLNIDDDNTLLGYHSIMESESNKTKEDYILNFDYLHEIGAITEEQYAAIEQYEKDMRRINDELIPAQQTRDTYNVKLPELQAKVTLYENSIKIDQERIDANAALQDALDIKDKENDDCISVTEDNPDRGILIERDSETWVNLNTNRGIVQSTLNVYGDWSSNTRQADDELTWEPDYDEYNNLIRIKNVKKPSNGHNYVYMTYKYDPQLYYQAIIDSWREKLGHDQDNYTQYSNELGTEDTTDPEKSTGLYKKIYDINQKCTELEDEKKELTRKFNEMMGPALREGYWQPESYNDYGEQKEYNYTLSQSYSEEWKEGNTGHDAKTGWDKELFDNEQKSSYEYGVNQDLRYYPCIDLSNIYNVLSDDITKYSFYFNNNFNSNANSDKFDWRYQKAYTVGSQAILAFAKEIDGDTVKPVLILVGAKSLTDQQIERMKNAQTGKARFGIITTSSDGQTVSITDNAHTIVWLDMSNYELVMPRIRFSSLDLKTQGNDLIIRYDGKLLKQFDDFYINTRNIERDETFFLEYFITIKPTTLLKTKSLTKDFNVNYILSNANTSIYLDALEVSHENAYPKVSYEITTNILDYEVINTLYKRLAQLVMINDTDLKFQNTFGYISHLELDLDQPQNDNIEIKNYKTKFEDLFSSIVASTEQMQRASSSMGAMMSGSVGLSEKGFSDTIANNYSIFESYLDSHFDSSEVVQNKLTELFTEAGQILADSSGSLNKMHTLTTDNAGILASFADNISKQLSVQVFRQSERPSTFKTGDIWIELDESSNEIARYVATYNSNEVSGTGGWVRTSDGTLAQIKGASLDINAVDGILDLTAENEIRIRSGHQLYLAADDNINIIGNKQIDIGGANINIAGGIESSNFDIISIDTDIFANRVNNKSRVYWFRYRDNQWTLDNVPINLDDYGITIEIKENQILINNEDQIYIQFDNTKTGNARIFCMNMGAIASGSINLVASGIINIDNEKLNYLTSKVLISPKKIEMGAAELEFKSASQMNFISSTGTTQNTSAIHISSDDGVWIGSGQPVRIFSGAVNVDSQTGKITDSNNTAITSASGASVELNSEHLILGYMNTNSGQTGNAIELDKDKIIIASGPATIGNADVTGTQGTLVGAKFTNSSIGFATSYTDSNNSIKYNAILMNNQGITIGSGSIDVTSPTSTLRSGNNGSYVRIASSGIDIGSSADLYINSNNFLIDSDAAETNNILRLGTDQSPVLSYSLTNGLSIKGNITATSNNGKFIASGSSLGFYTSSNNPVMTLSGTTISVASNYTLSVSGELSIAASSLKITSGSSTSTLENYVNTKISNAQIVMTNDQIWAGVKGATENTNLKLTDNSITMKATGASTASFNLTPDGITMQGKNITIDSGHLMINGKQEWSRDDIFFSPTTPTSYPTDREWIWIKPNYNTYAVYSINDINNDAASSSDLTGITTSVIYNGQSDQYITSGTASNGTQYEYEVTIVSTFGVTANNLSEQVYGTTWFEGYIGTSTDNRVYFRTQSLSSVRGTYLGRNTAYTYTFNPITYTSTINLRNNTEISTLNVWARPVKEDDDGRYAYIHSVTVKEKANKVLGGTLCDIYYYEANTGPQ